MREVIEKVEVWDDTDFLFTEIVYRENNDFFIANVSAPNREFDIDALTGVRVPIETQYLHLPDDIDNLLRAPTPIPADSYIKGIVIHQYDHKSSADAESLGMALIRELRVHEELRPYPHPSLCEYRGFVADDDGRITGLCFKKYSHTLVDAAWKKMDFDAKAVMEDFRNGVDHLHSLGWIHNDISAGNLMFDSDSRGIVIDLGDCTKEGTAINTGTPFWTKGSLVAEKGNDYYSLARAEKWIADGGHGVDW